MNILLLILFLFQVSCNPEPSRFRGIFRKVAIAGTATGAGGIGYAHRPQNTHLPPQFSRQDVALAGRASQLAYSNPKEIESRFKDVNVYSGNGPNFGFTGVDEENKKIIAAVRGTTNIENWKQNLNAGTTPYLEGNEGAKASKGFLDATNNLEGPMFSDLDKLRKKHPDKEVLFTGHR
jgi:hypothetical protein